MTLHSKLSVVPSFKRPRFVNVGMKLYIDSPCDFLCGNSHDFTLITYHLTYIMYPVFHHGNAAVNTAINRIDSPCDVWLGNSHDLALKLSGGPL